MSVTDVGRPSTGPRPLARRVIRSSAPANSAAVRCGLIDISLANLPTSVVFFYPGELDYPVLADGLAIALATVPVFAGRLRTDADGLWLIPTDAGVPFVHAEADETLASALARMTLAESGFVDHVQANAARTAELPLFTARLSRLADGTSALGISWHHAVGDLQSALLLLQSWSAAVANLPLPQPILVADRDAELLPLLPERDSGRASFRLPDSAEDEALIARTIASAPLANRTVQLYFTDAELARMRTELATTAGRRLSINDAVCAHVTATLWDLAEDDQPRRLAVPVNVRRQLGLPAELIGNLLGEIFLTLPARSGAAEIAAAVRDGIDNFTRDHLSLRANHDYLERIGRSELDRCVPIGFDPARRTVTLSNWSRFGLYQVAFGGQFPVAFSPAATTQIAWVGWLVEGFGGTGLLFTLALPAKLAAQLRKPEAQSALHRYRDADEELPVLARLIRKLG